MKQYGALDDVFYLWFAGNDTSGSGGDGASPAADVRLAGAAADAAPVYSPTPVLLSHVNYPAGAYEIAITASAANGFATGNTYAVFCTLAIDSQNPTGFIGSFDLKPVESNLIQIADAAVATGTAQLGVNVVTQANIDFGATQKASITAAVPTATNIIDEFETQSQADPTGFHVNVKEVNGTAQTANDNGADINNILVDTAEIGAAGIGLTDLGGMSTGMKAEVESEANDALVVQKLDHLVAVADADDVVDNSIIAKLASSAATADWSGFVNTTDALQAIRDRGDSAWTTGAGGSDRLLMVDTTIATLANQTSFTLTAGSADDDAYNNCTIVIEDVTTATQKAVGIISDYVGGTKTVTLKYDPAIFVMAATDKVYILAENALKATLANRQLNVAADGDIAGNVDGSVASVVGHTAQTGDSFARLGTAGAGLTALGDTRIAELEAANLPTDIANVKAETALIVADTNELQTDNIPALIATAQADLDLLTGADGATLATAQALYAPNKVVPDVAGTAAGLHTTTNGKVDTVQTDSTAIKAKTDNLPSGIAKNVALPKFDVYMVLSSDHVTAATGKTVAGKISKDGGAFASITNAITEVSDGMYKIADGFTQTEMNADVITLKFTETDCDQRIITIHTA